MLYLCWIQLRHFLLQWLVLVCEVWTGAAKEKDAYSHLPCPLQGSNLQHWHKETAESANLVNIPIMACQRQWFRVLDMNMLSVRWWKICNEFYSCLRTTSCPSPVCVPPYSHRHIVPSSLSFTLPLQLIHLEQNPAHFCCQSSWSAQCSLRVILLLLKRS